MSIVDFLKGQGQASDFTSRAKLAQQYGITGYQGTAAQNNDLLSAIRNAAGSTPTATGVAQAQLPSATKVQAPSPAASSFQRNYTQEQQAMQRIFGRTLSASELTPEVESLLFRATYKPDQIKQMGLGGDVGTTRMETNPALQDLAVQRGLARQDLFTKQPINTYLGVLEKALREKQMAMAGEGGVEGQVDRAMEAVGATGYAALASAMQAKVNAINSNYESLASVIKSTGQTLNDEFTATLNRYKLISDDYQALADRLFELDKIEEEANQQLELYRQKLQIDQELGVGDFAASRRTSGDGPSSDGDGIDFSKMTYGEALTYANKLMAMPGSDQAAIADLIRKIQSQAGSKSIDSTIDPTIMQSLMSLEGGTGIQVLTEKRNSIIKSKADELDLSILNPKQRVAAINATLVAQGYEPMNIDQENSLLTQWKSKEPILKKMARNAKASSQSTQVWNNQLSQGNYLLKNFLNN